MNAGPNNVRNRGLSMTAGPNNVRNRGSSMNAGPKRFSEVFSRVSAIGRGTQSQGLRSLMIFLAVFSFTSL